MFEYNTGDINADVFFFTSPEEMEYDAEQSGFLFVSSAIDTMSEEQFECYMELSNRMTESSSCTGLSNNAFLICRK